MKGFLSFLMHTSKNDRPFKIQRVESNTRLGITANSLESLKKKSAKRLKISEKQSRLILAEDGTEVDDEEYFSFLPPQTLFVLLMPGETWQTETTFSASRLYSVLGALLTINKEDRNIVNEIHTLMQEESNPAMLELMGKISSAVEMKIAISDRADDPEWFIGVESRFKTKEDVMKDRAKQRIRGYLHTVKDYIKDSKGTTLVMLKMLVEEFEQQLKKKEYFNHYFGRGSKEKTTFCDNEGWFQCEGPYNESKCPKPDHYINPYGSAEARLLFSTWNLDHGVEKSREVLPKMVEAVENLSKTKHKLNQNYFFDMMFTRKNLKLVHIACHDKKEHVDAKCDPKKFYI